MPNHPLELLDIVERVLSYLQKDTNSLIQCSLVSKTFADAAQSTLFRHLNLSTWWAPSLPPVDPLEQVLRSSLHGEYLCRKILAVDLNTRTLQDKAVASGRSINEVCDIWGELLPVVTHVNVQSDWSSPYPQCVTFEFLSRLPSLKHLAFHKMLFIGNRVKGPFSIALTSLSLTDSEEINEDLFTWLETTRTVRERTLRRISYWLNLPDPELGPLHTLLRKYNWMSEFVFNVCGAEVFPLEQLKLPGLLNCHTLSVNVLDPYSGRNPMPIFINIAFGILRSSCLPSLRIVNAHACFDRLEGKHRQAISPFGRAKPDGSRELCREDYALSTTFMTQLERFVIELQGRKSISLSPCEDHTLYDWDAFMNLFGIAGRDLEAVLQIKTYGGRMNFVGAPWTDILDPH